MRNLVIVQKRIFLNVKARFVLNVRQGLLHRKKPDCEMLLILTSG